MLSEFVENKLKKARYKLLPDGSYFGEIPSVRGVWANSKTLENCRKELQEVLEEWVLLKVRANEHVSGLSFPAGKQKALQHA
jgi:predicted RNase H-like HicB family nuclease